MSKTTSDDLVERLIDWGVGVVFGLPGDGINGIMEALRTRQDRIAFIQVRHEEAAALGDWVGKNLLPEFLTFWFKEASLQSVVVGYSRLTARYARAFEYEERSAAGRWTIVFKHGAGARWSVYYESLLRSALGGLLKGAEIHTEKTDDQVLARFSLAGASL